MNPAFILLVLLGAFLLWLLCSFLYVPIGRTVNRLLKDSHRAMNDGSLRSGLFLLIFLINYYIIYL